MHRQDDSAQHHSWTHRITCDHWNGIIIIVIGIISVVVVIVHHDRLHIIHT